jgi:serine/threonine protein kinase
MNYKKIEEIGRGSFGIVYEVSDKVTGERFALKEFANPGLPGISEADLKKRFEREVKYQKSIESENVVKIVDEDLTADPPYFVMELAICSLQNELEKDRTLGQKPQVALFDILSGLEALHDLGIVHRDLKPPNILKFKNEDGTFRYAISDFGLITPGTAATTTLTATNMKGGTERYAAPELAIDLKKATTQSDIYSFGAILHDIFSGAERTPYTELTVSQPYLAPIVQKCTKKLILRRYKTTKQLRSVLYDALHFSDVTFVSSEVEAISKMLSEKVSLSNDEWDQVFLCLDELQAKDESCHGVFQKYHKRACVRFAKKCSRIIERTWQADHGICIHGKFSLRVL